jgi:hypothetical protein
MAEDKLIVKGARERQKNGVRAVFLSRVLPCKTVLLRKTIFQAKLDGNCSRVIRDASLAPVFLLGTYFSRGHCNGRG